MAPTRPLSVYDDEPFPGAAAGCCVPLPRRSFSLGYRPLASDGGDLGSPAAAVTIVAGKERREFLVEPQVLESDAFKVLLGLAGSRRTGDKEVGRRSRNKRGGRGGPVFVGVDSIFFEHMLWLAENGAAASLPRRDLEDIIDFYSHEL
ncbi:unnamed protein product [Spirodela intermedia]|uniref:Uncharacterized protein n=1 Tax=Spirodela intermedia TaxID=51605 RepID=A0A7I8KDT2_SPIIN|nr:unnamed protein product [Spirodela intermedia]